MSAKPFAVRYAESTEERSLVSIGFVAPLYIKSYGLPPPLADAYAVVEDEGRIIATIGIEWPDANGQLGIERIYGIASEAGSRMAGTQVQLSRWASLSPAAGALAVFAATRYCLARGRRYALVEHNAVVHRRSKLLGIEFEDLPSSGIQLAQVPPQYQGFYAVCGMRPYRMSLEQAERALAERIGPFVIASR